MGYIDDDEDEYNDLRTHHRSREGQEPSTGSSSGDTSLMVAALCLPIWALGLIGLAWRWATETIPAGAFNAIVLVLGVLALATFWWLWRRDRTP